MRSLISCLALAIGSPLWLAAPSLASEKHALLIGVGEYDDERIDGLRAPENDVAGMAELSLRMGVPKDNLVILATSLNTGLTSASIDDIPTAANIIASFELLTSNVGSDDQVLIYLSGHGTQQPDQPVGTAGHDEDDGLDEVFLPMDATGALYGTEIQNGIIDDVIGQYVDEIRKVGASVWIVIDACHSGTALRSAATPGIYRKERYVDPSILGIVQRPVALSASPTSSRSLDFSEGLKGDIVAFFAVSPQKRAIEGQWIQSDGSFQETPFGLLTYGILQAGASGEILSYRDLAQYVMGTYTFQPGVGNIRPQFEGEFNRPVLGEGLVEPLSWSVDIEEEVLQLRGGSLDLIGEGAIFGIVNLASLSKIGLVRATEVGTTNTRLEPIGDFDIRPLLDNPPPRLRATLINAGVRLKISIDLSPMNAVASVEASARKAVAKAIGESDGQVVAVSDGAADVMVVPGADRIWIAPGGTDPALFDPAVRGPHWVGCENKDCSEELTRNLQRYLRAARLKRVLVSTIDGNIGPVMDVDVAFLHGQESSCAKFSPPNPAAYRSVQSSADVATGTRVSNCDQLWLKVTYNGGEALDVTPIYLAADGSISLLSGDTRRSVDMRILPSQTAEFFIRVRTEADDGSPYAIGLEDVLIIAVEQPADQPPWTYQWLATEQQVPLRGNGVDPLASALGDAADTTRLRSSTAVSSNSSSRSTIVQIPLDLKPSQK